MQNRSPKDITRYDIMNLKVSQHIYVSLANGEGSPAVIYPWHCKKWRGHSKCTVYAGNAYAINAECFSVTQILPVRIGNNLRLCLYIIVMLRNAIAG